MNQRLPRIEPGDGSKAAELLREYAERGGRPGAMVETMANSTALLRGYLDLSRALKRAHLDPRVSERISLAVQQWLGCETCLAAHTRAALAAGLSGLDVSLARQGTATDPRIAAIVRFGLQVAAAPAELTDADIDELRQDGWRDDQIADVVGVVALNVLTGAFNLVAGIHPAPATSDEEIP